MGAGQITHGEATVGPTAEKSGEVTVYPRTPVDPQHPTRRIDGEFCPCCKARIPRAFIFCTNCGRNV